MLEAPDMRPGASSQFAYQGASEKHGMVRTRDSVLPVELVLRGGLEDFGMSAFPRITPPSQSADAFLYR